MMTAGIYTAACNPFFRLPENGFIHFFGQELPEA